MKKINPRIITLLVLLVALLIFPPVAQTNTTLASSTGGAYFGTGEAYFCAITDYTETFYKYAKANNIIPNDTDATNLFPEHEDMFAPTILAMLYSKQYDKIPDNLSLFQNQFWGYEENEGLRGRCACQDYDKDCQDYCPCTRIRQFLEYAYTGDNQIKDKADRHLNGACRFILAVNKLEIDYTYGKKWYFNATDVTTLAGDDLDEKNAANVFEKCLDKIHRKNMTTIVEPEPEEAGEPLKPPPPINKLDQKHPSWQDFKDMGSVFVPYIREVLNGCLDDTNGNTKAKDRCADLKQSSEREADRYRLAFLITLVAHGSHGLRTNDKNDIAFSQLTNEGPYMNEILPTESGSGGKSQLSIKCPLFSDISDFVPMAEATRFDIEFGGGYSRVDLLCQTKNTPMEGVNNLISLCQRERDGRHDVNKCNRIIGKKYEQGGGFLSDNKNRPHQLQTMYWNIIDIPPLSGQGAITTWKPISQKEKEYMLDVINNPLDIKEPIEDEASPTIRSNMGFAGQCLKMDLGLGSIICSITDGMIKMVNWMMEIIHDVIANQNTIIKDDGTGISVAWRSFLNIANVFFIIVFLVIIFSQLTGRGISDYGIKTLLPKLIVAAILANLSLFGVRILMEISSIVGSGLFNLMVDVSWEELFVSKGDWVLTILLVTSPTIRLLALLIIIVVLLILRLCLTVQVLLLNLRSALIVLVAITAPLAAALFILPNTTKVTRVWWRITITTALIHPILAVLYGSGTLAYVATGGGDETNALKALVYRSMIILPMFVGPFVIWQLFKNMPILATAIAAISQKAKTTFGQIINPDPKSERGQRKAEKIKEIDSRVQSGTYKGWRPFRRLKSEVFRMGLGQSRLFAQGTAEAMQQIEKTRDERSDRISGQSAIAILNDINAKYTGGNDRASYRNLSEQEQRTYDQHRSPKLAIGGRVDKDAALDANLAFVKNEIKQNGAVDGVQILKNLQAARLAGASQVELSSVYRQIMGQLEANDQMVAIGELKANLEFNNNLVGVFNQSLYDDITPNGQVAHDDLLNQREIAIRTALHNGIINRETPEGEPKLILNANMFPDGSLGTKILQEELINNPSMRETVQIQSGAFSIDFIRRLQTLDPTLDLKGKSR